MRPGQLPEPTKKLKVSDPGQQGGIWRAYGLT